MASIASIHLPRSRSAVGTAANLRSLFRGRKFLKLLKGLTVGQAVPEIPLSEGSKLELHCTSQSFCLCQISVYFPVHARICPRMYIHVLCRVHLYVYIILGELECLPFLASGSDPTK